MKIAILDNKNEDIGLKILFPEADYYICSTTSNREESYRHYNFLPKYNVIDINDKNYDVLFVIMPLRHIVNDEESVRDIRGNYDNHIKPIIDNNKFKFLAFFDNEDYDVNPNNYVKIPNAYFFKRNYDSKKYYENNVFSFPFIMFGQKSLIEKIDRELVPKEEYFNAKNNRIFFTGGLYNHHDTNFNVFVNRRDKYFELQEYLTNPGYLPLDQFMKFARESKFGLDLLGAGNPNIKTFEILVSGSLILQQKNNLVWPFPEKFSDECFFETKEEFIENLNKLSNPEIYNKCLLNQYNIVNKYFNIEWIRFYILSKLYTYYK
jgi:hypothetical protein